MNDDVDGAEDGLSEGTSSFHNVRVWVVGWMMVPLGLHYE